MLEFTLNEINYLTELLEEKIEECREDNTQAARNDLEIYIKILNKINNQK